MNCNNFTIIKFVVISIQIKECTHKLQNPTTCINSSMMFSIDVWVIYLLVMLQMSLFDPTKVRKVRHQSLISVI